MSADDRLAALRSGAEVDFAGGGAAGGADVEIAVAVNVLNGAVGGTAIVGRDDAAGEVPEQAVGSCGGRAEGADQRSGGGGKPLVGVVAVGAGGLCKDGGGGP